MLDGFGSAFIVLFAVYPSLGLVVLMLECWANMCPIYLALGSGESFRICYGVISGNVVMYLRRIASTRVASVGANNALETNFTRSFRVGASMTALSEWPGGCAGFQSLDGDLDPCRIALPQW